MASPRRARSGRAAPVLTRGRIGAVAAGVVLALVATLAVIWPGYDAQQTPLDDGTIWALQRASGGHYARVNAQLGEIDTVKTISQPTTLAQSGDGLWAFAASGTRVADVDPAVPANLDADAADAFRPTPEGTRDIALGGAYVAYLTESGDLLVGALRQSRPVEVQAETEDGRFVADAVAVAEDGTVVAYSSAQAAVLRADAATGAVRGIDAVTRAPEGDVEVTVVGSRWALLDPTSGLVWIDGIVEPITTGALPGARLGLPTTEGAEVYLADEAGLIGVDSGSGAIRQVFGGSATLGVAAAPMPRGGDVFAAWLPPSGGGTLWGPSGQAALDYAGQDIGPEPTPEFVRNDVRAILNDTQSGWVWTVPDGALVPSSQRWQLDEDSSTSDTQDAAAPRVLEPKPPVAVDDTFGVRAGRSAILPVLMNDHDPNEDVLTVVAASVTAPSVGQVATVNADQQLVIDVPADASGSTSLSYQATDGTAADGLTSAPATVTVTVVPETVNTAPVSCAQAECAAQWPAPTVAPGGTVRFAVLDTFIDPESDPFYVAGATITSGAGSVTVDPAGIVTYQHPDANSTATASITVQVAVQDVRGARTERDVTITVTPTPRLEADSFALTTVVGRPIRVDLGDRVRGASGTPTLSSVSAGTDDAAVTVNASALSFTYTAAAEGSTVLQYTVRDGDTEQTATVRVTAVASAAAALSSPPLVAFVRPSEDTTVDVLAAVSNPAELVLLLSDLRPEPAPGAALSVDPVGQSTIRASGTTADGAPGELGVVRYTISDGSGQPGAAITGQLTVVLLDAAQSDPPIAVADTATVRVGEQIDIPVLANDSAPTGGLLVIDPSRVVNDNDAGLAFATSRVLRYLAPDTPGIYSVSYTISRLGFPELTDTARVTITVQGGESNTAPSPRTLEGRALSGRSTAIAFDAFGIDPDGDTVVLDAVLDQPVAADGTPAGTATISADGSSLVYTAPTTWSGQASFTYRVRDSRGATATALALVGVRDAQSDPRPVTFSDYVQLETSAAGTGAPVTVTPLENDVDPSGTPLTLLDVRPNAPDGSAEYEQLEDLLDAVDLSDGTVALRAGSALGTFSFVYTVQNAAGDTAMGLIVLKVVRNPVPAYPDVRDTILTAETIDDFAAGIDVLSGTVSWRGGDPDDLALSLWREMPGVQVEGSRISGTPPEQSLVIPFAVTGVGFDGREVTSYGFLRVPGATEVRPSIRAGQGAVTVGENESVDIDLAAAIAVPRSAQVEISSAVAPSGARTAASCALVGATTLRYSAGAGAPWTDTCTVPARLAGQEQWTTLTVRVTVEAEAPQPFLSAASRTLGPGQTEIVDLRQLTSWTGTPNWASIDYDVAYAGDQFRVSVQGSQLTVTGLDDARPGRTESVQVRLSSHPDAAPASLTLVVGPAPSTLPKAGSVTQQCSQAGGTSSCEIVVVGSAGEVNPLPGTALRVAEVTSPANCPDVTFTVASTTSVRASWTTDAPGAADCTGSVVVADAQGRLSTGDRSGAVILDLRGLPATPATIEWTSFDRDGVVLRVSSSGSSYPAVEGYRVRGGGVDIRCDASGACPEIPAAVGEKVSYQAWAVNSVGESRAATSAVTAWAYAAPAAPSGASASPVPTADGAGGVAAVTVTGLDPTTGSVRVTSPVTGGSETVAVPAGATEVTLPAFVVGANRETSLTITPLSRFDYPTIAVGSTEGSTRTLTAYGVGAPLLSLRLEPTDDGSGDVRAIATVTANGVGTTLDVGIVTSGTCTPVPVGDVTAAVVERTLAGTVWEQTTASACARYRIGDTSFGFRVAGPVSATPTEPIPAPTGSSTYTVSPSPIVEGLRVHWTDVSGPSFAHPRYETRYLPGNTTDFASLFSPGRDPGSIRAAWCVGSVCSDETTAVSPTGAAYTAQVTFPSTCSADGQPGDTMVDAAPGDFALTTVGTPIGDGTQTEWEITVTWLGRLAGLDSYTATGLTCPTATP